MDEKKLHCEKCQYSTLSNFALKTHKIKHTNERPYKCRFCGSIFKYSHDMTRHIKKEHPEQIQGENTNIDVKVTINNNSNNGNINISNNNNNENNENSKYEMESDDTERSDGENSNENSNSNENATEDNLKETNDNEKKDGGKEKKMYKCNLCNKSYCYPSLLQCHLITHSSDKPHKCPYTKYGCTKCYKRKKNVTSHMAECPFRVEAEGEKDKEKEKVIKSDSTQTTANEQIMKETKFVDLNNKLHSNCQTMNVVSETTEKINCLNTQNIMQINEIDQQKTTSNIQYMQNVQNNLQNTYQQQTYTNYNLINQTNGIGKPVNTIGTQSCKLGYIQSDSIPINDVYNFQNINSVNAIPSLSDQISYNPSTTQNILQNDIQHTYQNKGSAGNTSILINQRLPETNSVYQNNTNRYVQSVVNDNLQNSELSFQHQEASCSTIPSINMNTTGLNFIGKSQSSYTQQSKAMNYGTLPNTAEVMVIRNQVPLNNITQDFSQIQKEEANQNLASHNFHSEPLNGFDESLNNIPSNNKLITGNSGSYYNNSVSLQPQTQTWNLTRTSSLIYNPSQTQLLNKKIPQSQTINSVNSISRINQVTKPFQSQPTQLNNDYASGSNSLYLLQPIQEQPRAINTVFESTKPLIMNSIVSSVTGYNNKHSNLQTGIINSSSPVNENDKEENEVCDDPCCVKCKNFTEPHEDDNDPDSQYKCPYPFCNYSTTSQLRYNIEAHKIQCHFGVKGILNLTKNPILIDFNTLMKHINARGITIEMKSRGISNKTIKERLRSDDEFNKLSIYKDVKCIKGEYIGIKEADARQNANFEVYICNHCASLFATVEDLYKHQKTKHTEYIVICTCGYSFYRNKGLLSHRKKYDH